MNARDRLFALIARQPISREARREMRQLIDEAISEAGAAPTPEVRLLKARIAELEVTHRP